MTNAGRWCESQEGCIRISYNNVNDIPTKYHRISYIHLTVHKIKGYLSHISTYIMRIFSIGIRVVILIWSKTAGKGCVPSLRQEYHLMLPNGPIHRFLWLMNAHFCVVCLLLIICIPEKPLLWNYRQILRHYHIGYMTSQVTTPTILWDCTVIFVISPPLHTPC